MGVGVTDDPASAGIDQFKFSRSKDVEKMFSFPGVQFNSSKTLVEEKGFFDRFLPNKKDINHSDEVDETMNENQFSKFQDGMNKQFGTLATVLEGITSSLDKLNESQKSFSKKIESKENQDNGDEESTPVTAEMFSTLTNELKDLKSEFGKLSSEELPGSGSDGDNGTGGEENLVL